MPPEVLGPSLAVAFEGYNVHESCSGGYLVQHRGEVVGNSQEVVQSIFDGSPFLLVGGDIISSGVGLCCPDSGAEDRCIVLRTNLPTFDLAETIARIDEVFPEEMRCFGVRVELEGNTSPRCDADDPTCLPLPVCHGQPDEPCCQAPEYDPSAERIPVYEDNPYGEQLCEHDGECVVSIGYGHGCVSWLEPPSAGVLGCTDEISEAYCGCVANECQWYDQG